MFNFTDTSNAKSLEARIDALLEELGKLTGSDQDYTTTVDNLAKLIKLQNDSFKLESDCSIEEEKLHIDRAKLDLDEEKLNHEKTKLENEKEKSLSWKPSADAIVTAAASVLGIAMILHYEKFNAVTSKAVGFVTKMK